MEKKLPGIYKNPIDHPVKNNKEMTYAREEKEEIIKENNFTKEEKIKNTLFGGEVSRKINDIFKSSSYVYKASVEIITKNGTLIKNVIGKSRDMLITIDNELIPIADIEDIKLIHEKNSD